MVFFNYMELLKNLSTDTEAVWGKMTAQHMVEHLTMAVKSSTGKIIFTRFITPEDKLEISKRILNSNRPLPKLFVNEIVGEGLKSLVNKNLDSAIEELKNEVKYFEEYFKHHHEAKPINATFGPLNHEEWITFHNKHFTHHLTQFGLIKE